MASRTRRFAMVTAVAVLALAAAALYASPYWTLRTLHTAVQDQDATTVAKHVDFPALREDLKGQLLLKMQRDMATRPGVESQPLSGLGQMFAMGLVNQMVDGLVSPTGVALALKNGAVLRGMASGIPAAAGTEAPQGAESSDGQPQPQPKNPQRDFTVRYDNWSTVQVQPKDGSKGGFTLHRDGLLSWKLVALDLSALSGQKLLKR